MVSKFREFLNYSPRFEELRGSRRPLPTRPVRGSLPLPTDTSMDREGFEDENGDDNDDYEGLDGNEMVLDAQVQNPWQHLNANGQPHPMLQHLNSAIPVPPPAPESMGPLQFSSFLNNQPAYGTPPLSAHGHASMASLTQATGAQRASTANAGSSTRTSTAPVHPPTQDPEQPGYEEMD